MTTDTLILCDDLLPAFVGIVERFGAPPIACYDYDAVIDLYVHRDGMTPEEAAEYFEFNVLGAWVGDHTPCFVHRGASPSEFLE